MFFQKNQDYTNKVATVAMEVFMATISTRVHTILSVIVGILLLLAPTIFQFNSNPAATWTAMVIGAFFILNELITTSPLSPVKLIPMRAHLLLDVITGLALAVSPLLFNFFEFNHFNQWVPHLAVGLIITGYALLSTPDEKRQTSHKR